MISFDDTCDLLETIMNETLILDSDGEFVRMLLPSDPLPIPFPSGSVGTLMYANGSGSAFVVATQSDQENPNTPIALVMTTAHNYYFPQEPKRNEHPWLFTFELRPPLEYHQALARTNQSLERFTSDFKTIVKHFEAYLAVPIEKTINWTDYPEIDPVTLNRTTIKGDYMLFAVYNKSPFPIPLPKRKRTKFIKLSLQLEPLPENTYECFLFGRPGPMNRAILLATCPHAKRKSLLDAQSVVHEGNQMLVSKGMITGIGELIAATCPSHSGMSGGPLCIVVNNEWHVVGLLVGSCASMFHFPLHAILGNAVHPLMSFNQLIDLLRVDVRNNEVAENFFTTVIQKHNAMSTEDFIEEIEDMAYNELKRGFKEGRLILDHNIFFPIWNIDLKNYLATAASVHNFRGESRRTRRKCNIF